VPGNVEPKTDAGPSPTGSGDGRVGKRTAAAAFRIATHLVDENLITPDEALARVANHQLAQLMLAQFDSEAPRTLLAHGMAASPGCTYSSSTPTSRGPSNEVISTRSA